jgi:hypothetical protein
MASFTHTHDSSKASPSRAMAHQIQAKLQMGQVGDRYEQEADQAAEQVVNRTSAGDVGGAVGPVSRISKSDFGQRKAEEKKVELPVKIKAAPKPKVEKPQAKEKKAADAAEKEKKSSPAKEKPKAKEGEKGGAKPPAPKKPKPEPGSEKAQPKLQRQEEEEETMQAKEEEEEAAQPKLQRQEEEEEAMQAKEEEEEAAQPKLQRQEEEEEAMQTKEEEEEAAQPKLQRQEEEEEAMQAKEEEEEAAQPKLQRQEEEEEAMQAKEEEEEAAQPKLQRQEEEEEAMQAKEEEEEAAQPKLQRQEEEEEAMQAKKEPRANLRDKAKYPVLNGVEPTLLRSRGRGEPLSEEVRRSMEASFGADFSKVRIHTGADAIAMCREMRAKAFTSGSDIYFNEGKFDPESVQGRLLLSHELTHVIQQGKAEQQVSEAKIQQNNAKRNEPGPQPPDKNATQLKEELEAQKKAAAEDKGEKPDEVQLGMYGDKDLQAPPDKAKAKPASQKKGKPAANKKKKGLLSEVGKFLKKQSQGKVAQKKAKLQQLANNQKEKEDAATKRKRSEEAVVPPAQESLSKANASQVETVEQAPQPEPDETQAKESFDRALEQAVPSSLEAMDEFKEQGKGKEVGEQARAVVTADATQVQSTYQEIENAPDPEPTEDSDPLPEIEQAPETPPIDLGEDVLGEVQPEQTDMSEFENEADKQVEKEGITEEQMEMVDSGPLAEAKEERKKVKDTSKKAPEAVKSVEKEQKEKVKQELKSEEKAEKEKMQQERKKKLQNTQDDQKKTKNTIEEKRKAVTDHINGIYERTNQKVKAKLEALEKQSLQAFDQGQKRATQAFENNVKRRLDAFKADRYSGMFGWARWLKDKLLGMDELPAVKRIFDSERATFVDTLDALIKKITADSKQVVKECKEMLSKAKEEIKNYVDSLGPELRSVGEQAQQEMQQKLDELDKQVDQAQEKLQQKLEEKREAAIKAIDEKIEKMKEEMSGALGKLASLILNALLKFFKWAIEKIGGSADTMMGVLNKGKDVITRIVKAPGKFFGNLGRSVKMGFKKFQTNFKKHLMTGLVEWLAGPLGQAGLVMPEKFDLKGVMSIGLQVLGLTWDVIRTKLVKRVGEKLVAGAEKGMEIFQKIRTEGPLYFWDMLKEKAAELKQQAIAGISKWAVFQIVKKATIKLLSMLNPVGAILQIVLGIYDAVVWFIDNKDRIVDFIKTIFASIGDIAMGKLGKAAAGVEKALAKAVPIILAFLAQFLGLGGIGKAIKKVIKTVRKPIDKVINKVIKFLVKKVKSLFKKGKKGKVVKKEKKKEADKRGSKKEREKNKQKARKEIEKALGKGITRPKLKAMLPGLKSKYKLKKISLDNKDDIKIKNSPVVTIKGLSVEQGRDPDTGSVTTEKTETQKASKKNKNVIRLGDARYVAENGKTLRGAFDQFSSRHLKTKLPFPFDEFPAEAERPIKVSASLFGVMNKLSALAKRDGTTQGLVGKFGNFEQNLRKNKKLSGWKNQFVGGHIIAHRFGGKERYRNLAPMSNPVNTSYYGKIERFVADKLKALRGARFDPSPDNPKLMMNISLKYPSKLSFTFGELIEGLHAEVGAEKGKAAAEKRKLEDPQNSASEIKQQLDKLNREKSNLIGQKKKNKEIIKNSKKVNPEGGLKTVRSLLDLAKENAIVLGAEDKKTLRRIKGAKDKAKRPIGVRTPADKQALRDIVARVNSQLLPAQQKAQSGLIKIGEAMGEKKVRIEATEKEWNRVKSLSKKSKGERSRLQAEADEKARGAERKGQKLSAIEDQPRTLSRELRNKKITAPSRIPSGIQVEVIYKAQVTEGAAGTEDFEKKSSLDGKKQGVAISQSPEPFIILENKKSKFKKRSEFEQQQLKKMDAKSKKAKSHGRVGKKRSQNFQVKFSVKQGI